MTLGESGHRVKNAFRDFPFHRVFRHGLHRLVASEATTEEPLRIGLDAGLLQHLTDLTERRSLFNDNYFADASGLPRGYVIIVIDRGICRAVRVEAQYSEPFRRRTQIPLKGKGFHRRIFFRFRDIHVVVSPDQRSCQPDFMIGYI